MSAQLALPFVSIVGAASSAVLEDCPEVKRPRRNLTRKRAAPVADRSSETPPKALADDDSRCLDVHDYLIRNGDACFVFQVRDDSMADAEIFDGDLLVVDQSIQPAHGHIVLAFVNGERLVRRLYHRGRKTALQSGSADQEELVLEDGSELTIWGVVAGKFKRFLA